MTSTQHEVPPGWGLVDLRKSNNLNFEIFYWKSVYAPTRHKVYLDRIYLITLYLIEKGVI